ncbi:hypothetical protein [Nonomuraea typhae]|uniref:hypothetical protein n=1 Tax=Nonomuraea typhae TaxID=2603600 RepID=UPI0012F7A388|nr:hypothetical protein [Nonomuraea typhae]
MNHPHLITDYLRCRHTDLLAEAATERLAHQHLPSRPSTSPLAPIRHHLAEALHHLAHRIDPDPSTPF